ncbi:MAG: hypothetical protein KDG49_15540, partial [Geminicoccaceae bacterium]|nr:hypothetical protein [Geminicoccaceae bacterium]
MAAYVAQRPGGVKHPPLRQVCMYFGQLACYLIFRSLRVDRPRTAKRIPTGWHAPCISVGTDTRCRSRACPPVPVPRDRHRSGRMEGGGHGSQQGGRRSEGMKKIEAI